MDTMEITKIVAGICGSLLVFLGIKYFIVEPLYSHEGYGEETLAYSVAAEEESEPAGTKEEAAVDFAALVAAADVAKGEKKFSKCKACHKLEAGKNAVGPSLFGVVGRDIGSEPGFNYSSAMTSVEGSWTTERLAHFLVKPKAYVPGTKMTFAGFKKPEDAAAVAAFLATVK
ncbi:MAG: cytochrome c family protein [Alphaproteobacteria bacterium]|nr:MAG: cytochrome c family protein [Alphaproteobacteria bacterium]